MYCLWLCTTNSTDTKLIPCRTVSIPAECFLKIVQYVRLSAGTDIKIREQLKMAFYF